MLLVPAIGMRLWSEERRSGTMELLFTMPIAPWHAIVGKYLAGCAILGLALGLTFPMWLTVNYLGDPDNGVILAGYLGSLLVACSFLAVSSATSAMTRNQVISFVISFLVCMLLNLAGFPPVTELFRRGEPIKVTAVALVAYVVVWAVLAVFLGVLGRGVRSLAQSIGLWTVGMVLALATALLFVLLVVYGTPVAESMGDTTTPAAAIRAVAGLGVIPHFEEMSRGKIELRALVYFASLISFCLFVTAVILQNRRAS
jgi:ABC-2 type transport system permease protein